MLGGAPERPVRVYGAVTANGNPMEVGVFFRPAIGGQAWADTVHVQTGRGRRVRGRAPHAGDWVVSAREGWSFGAAGERALTIPDGVEEFEHSIEMPVGSISGWVTNEAGDPLDDVDPDGAARGRGRRR